jgi:Domain of unknown function (DUF4123)/FHA domain
MPLFLEVLSGRYAGTRIEIPAGQTVQVGRTTKANVVFAEDAHMSSLHFALDWVSGGLAVRDLASRNGTFVNGQRIEQAPLVHGDRIRAGSTELLLYLEGEPAAAGPAVVASPQGAASPAVVAGSPGSPPIVVSSHTMGPASPPVRSTLAPVGAPSPAAGDRPQTVQKDTEPAPVIGTASPATLLEAPWLPPLTPVTTKLLEALRGQFQPLYAILDAARDPLVLAILFQSDQEYQSLYEGPEGNKLSVVAPYLVRLPKDSPLLEVVVRASWGKSWGVFLTSDSPLADVRRHLRHFLMVKLPDGKQVYFRFYDPRVLRVYLPTCTVEETRAFFGPIKSVLMEEEKPEAALCFAPGDRGVQKVVAPLAPKGGSGSAGASVVT